MLESKYDKMAAALSKVGKVSIVTNKRNSAQTRNK